MNVNYRYGPDELVYLLTDSDTEAVIVHAEFADIDASAVARAIAGVFADDALLARAREAALGFQARVTRSSEDDTLAAIEGVLA